MFEGYVIYVDDKNESKKLLFNDMLDDESIDDFFVKRGWKYNKIIELYKNKISKK